MKQKQTIWVATALGCVIGTAIFAQSRRSQTQHRETSQKTEDRSTPATDVVQAPSLDHVSMFVSDDGRMEIAGIVRFEYTETGDMLVEVREDGDFDTDPVLALNVPIEVTDDGDVVTTGIQAVGRRGQNGTLRLRTTNLGSVGAASGCIMKNPINGDPPFCEGECTVHSPYCGWAIDDQNKNLICLCQIAPL